MPVVEYACSTCKDRRGMPLRTEHLHRKRTFEDGVWVDHGDAAPDRRPCRKCGGDARLSPSAPPFRIARTNFYDESAGRTFADEAEMKRWCADHGVSEDNGGGDEWWRTQQAAVRASEEESEREFQEYADRLDHDPAFAEHRRLKDRGFYADQAVADAKKAGYSDVTADDIAMFDTSTPNL